MLEKQIRVVFLKKSFLSKEITQKEILSTLILKLYQECVCIHMYIYFLKAIKMENLMLLILLYFLLWMSKDATDSHHEQRRRNDCLPANSAGNITAAHKK